MFGAFAYGQGFYGEGPIEAEQGAPPARIRVVRLALTRDRVDNTALRASTTRGLSLRKPSVTLDDEEE